MAVDVSFRQIEPSGSLVSSTEVGTYELRPPLSLNEPASAVAQSPNPITTVTIVSPAVLAIVSSVIIVPAQLFGSTSTGWCCQAIVSAVTDLGKRPSFDHHQAAGVV